MSSIEEYIKRLEGERDEYKAKALTMESRAVRAEAEIAKLKKLEKLDRALGRDLARRSI